MRNKFKNHFKNTIIYLTSSSILLSSCDGYEGLEVTQKDFTKVDKLGANLLPIEIYLSDDEIKYVKSVEGLIKDLLSNKELVKQLSENPQSFLAKYNLDSSEFDLKNSEIQMIIALNDPEVLECLEKGKFKKYWKTLEKKGLFDIERSDLLSTINSKLESLSKDNVIRLKSTGELDEDDDTAWLAICAVVALIYVAVGTIAVAALATVAEAATAVHAATTVVNDASSSSSTGSDASTGMGAATGADMSVNGPINAITMKSTSVQEYYIDNLLEGNILRLWKDKSSNPSTFDLSTAEDNILIDILKSARNNGIISHKQLKDALQYANGLLKK